MTDKTLEDLVTKHDGSINKLLQNIEQLTNAQYGIAEQLKQLYTRVDGTLGFLTEQKIILSKIENIEHNIEDSIKRVHKRIDAVENVHSNGIGCESVKLLSKDVISLTKDINRVAKMIESHADSIDFLNRESAGRLSPAVARVAVGFVITYMVSFGAYVVNSINNLWKQEEINKTIIKHYIQSMKK